MSGVSGRGFLVGLVLLIHRFPRCSVPPVGGGRSPYAVHEVPSSWVVVAQLCVDEGEEVTRRQPRLCTGEGACKRSATSASHRIASHGVRTCQLGEVLALVRQSIVAHNVSRVAQHLVILLGRNRFLQATTCVGGGCQAASPRRDVPHSTGAPLRCPNPAHDHEIRALAREAACAADQSNRPGNDARGSPPHPALSLGCSCTHRTRSRNSGLSKHYIARMRVMPGLHAHILVLGKPLL